MNTSRPSKHILFQKLRIKQITEGNVVVTAIGGRDELVNIRLI